MVWAKQHKVAETDAAQPTTFDSPYSVQAPFNSPTVIGLRYGEVLKNTIIVPQINGDSVTSDQVVSMLVRNMETFERDG